MKKTAIFISVLFLYSFCFSQSSKNLKQFIRGNIQDKISSIRNASQEENVSISLMALDFCLQNKAVLEDDRDLDALCLLSLLSLPYNYTDSLSQDEKAEFSEKILEIFNSFSDENVRIAVLNKISSGKLDSPSFVELLNSFSAFLIFMLYNFVFNTKVVKLKLLRLFFTYKTKSCQLLKIFVTYLKILGMKISINL